jgi:hypothetical protein
MEFKENDTVIFEGFRAVITDVYDDGYAQIKFRNASGQNRVRLAKIELLRKVDESKSTYTPRPTSYKPEFLSNSIITRRNGGIRHQFIDSIGGDSSNYR